METLTSTATRLAQARREAGLSQEEVALRLGVTNDTVSRWERGQNDPSLSLVTQLAGFYRVSLDWIAGLVPHKSGLRPGQTVVDTRAVDRLREAVNRGDSLRDVQDLVRPPGVDCAWDIPDDPKVINSTAAKELHLELRNLIEKLRKTR